MPLQATSWKRMSAMNVGKFVKRWITDCLTTWARQNQASVLIYLAVCNPFRCWSRLYLQLRRPNLSWAHSHFTATSPTLTIGLFDSMYSHELPLRLEGVDIEKVYGTRLLSGDVDHMLFNLAPHFLGSTIG